jgi:hypothetical protein
MRLEREREREREKEPRRESLVNQTASGNMVFTEPETATGTAVKVSIKKPTKQ